MKKNKFMRLASVMLMLCLITTCAISGTFAKYTTSASATDQARVAKWGVTVTMMAGETIFDDMYGAGDVGVDSDPNVAGINVSTPVDVVAPGTKGTLSTIAVDGTPEVTVDVTTRIKLNLTNWSYDDDGDPLTPEVVYCPLVFTVGGETYGLTGTKDINDTLVTNQLANVAALEEAVINAIFVEMYGEAGSPPAWTAVTSTDANYEKQVVVRYAPNHDFNITEEFKWEWSFDGNDDVKDTALGDKAVNGTAPEIDFAMQVIVDQVD